MIRDSLSEELNIMVDPAAVLKEYVARQPFPSHEIIIAEVGEWKNGYNKLKGTLFQKQNLLSLFRHAKLHYMSSHLINNLSTTEINSSSERQFTLK